ncbi:hypothetical protein ABZ793_12280 [Micromonospora sp. NPDC047465]|uniref:hypothetical protein n=1 Tax=Micromonospora sp. NPDC047465 TaxID=3154813 RepID=UPI0033CEFEF3
MTRLPHYAAALALAAAVLASCTSDPEPAAAPTTSAPAPTSAAPSPSPSVDDKRGCRAVDALDGKSEPTAYRDAGALAAESTVPGIKQAGLDLVNAANDAVAEPGFDANMALDRAVIAVAKACADEFGDGPWE